MLPKPRSKGTLREDSVYGFQDHDNSVSEGKINLPYPNYRDPHSILFNSISPHTQHSTKDILFTPGLPPLNRPSFPVLFIQPAALRQPTSGATTHLSHVFLNFSHCMMCWLNFFFISSSLILLSNILSCLLHEAWQIFCGLRRRNFRGFLFLDNAPRSILNWANGYGDPACSSGCLSLLKRLRCIVIRVWGASFLRWVVSW
jgi:hypothetical protein